MIFKVAAYQVPWFKGRECAGKTGLPSIRDSSVPAELHGDWRDTNFGGLGRSSMGGRDLDFAWARELIIVPSSPQRRFPLYQDVTCYLLRDDLRVSNTIILPWSAMRQFDTEAIVSPNRALLLDMGTEQERVEIGREARTTALHPQSITTLEYGLISPTDRPNNTYTYFGPINTPFLEAPDPLQFPTLKSKYLLKEGYPFGILFLALGLHETESRNIFSLQGLHITYRAALAITLQETVSS